MKIVTEYVFPPIPIRLFDWSAVTDGYEPGEPIGYGPTEGAAIADLKEQLGHACARCGEPNPDRLDRDGCRDPGCPERGR